MLSATLHEWKRKIEQLQQRWRGARQENERLRKENEVLRRREKQWESEREQWERERKRLERERERLRGEIDNLKRQLERSEEHTSELQSRLHLVCRLLLEKKNCPHGTHPHPTSVMTCGILRSRIAMRNHRRDMLDQFSSILSDRPHGLVFVVLLPQCGAR